MLDPGGGHQAAKGKAGETVVPSFSLSLFCQIYIYKQLKA
jgi:hypothetical protein